MHDHWARNRRSTQDKLRGLNRFLTAVYGAETRPSSLLAQLGYSPQQIEAMRAQHFERALTSLVEAIRERVASWRDGERLWFIVCRRFGFDGKPPETLQGLGQQLDISRERVRQLERKALRRCRTRASKRHWEATLQSVASSCVGAPEGGGIPSGLPRDEAVSYPSVGSKVQAVVPSDRVDDDALASVAPGVLAILRTIKSGLSVSMLAHVLAGSKGPVVDAVVAHYGLSQYGMLSHLRYSMVRELVRRLCTRETFLVSEAGRIRLKVQP